MPTVMFSFDIKRLYNYQYFIKNIFENEGSYD